MEDTITFQELYEAYELCLKNKKRKAGTFNFVNNELCENLINLLDELNNRAYSPKSSNCYVVTEPALREIYAAQFGDRVVQHFYMKEVSDILEARLVEGCCSCIKDRGTEYALKLLKRFLRGTSNDGKKDCFFLKIDLSGYFMSIDRKQISDKFLELISTDYKGKHKDLLLYLTPIIFQNNPSLNCYYKCSESMRAKVPNRRKMDPTSEYGMAIGNLTAQAASNLNLSDFDNYVVKQLGLNMYVRYVDDIVIISESKSKLINALPIIKEKLKETHQKISDRKTKIDTAYHGVPFLGKVSYPYGYQKANKHVIIRVCQKAREVKYTDKVHLLAETNSQIGFLKKYNCKKLILNYVDLLPDGAKELLEFDNIRFKFKLKEEEE